MVNSRMVEVEVEIEEKICDDDVLFRKRCDRKIKKNKKGCWIGIFGDIFRHMRGLLSFRKSRTW